MFLVECSYFDGAVIGSALVSPAMAETIAAGNKLTVSGTISDATASVYVNDGTLVVEDGTVFSNNTDPVTGGVIANHGTVQIGNNVTFKSNRSEDMGGVIYSEPGTNGVGKITIGDNAKFLENTAPMGGAIYLFGVNELTIGKNAEFNGNATDMNYGGGAIVVLGDKQTQWAASGKGEGVTIVNIGENAIFSNNSSLKGGAIYFGERSIKATFASGATFKNNVATERGGAIFNTDDLTLTKATFTNNTAGTNGGAIFNTKTVTTTNIDASTFENNSATNSGGAIYNIGQNVNIISSAFTSNTAGTDGGAIYNGASAKLALSGRNTFSGNTAAGTKNDIYNLGKITVSGTLELDGGISGTGTTTFAAGSKLIATAGVTAISNTVINEGASLDLKVANGVEGEYTLITGSLDVEFDPIAIDNNLYNIVADTSKAGTYMISKKSTEKITEAIGATGNQAATIEALTGGVTGNQQFDDVASNIANLLQSSNPEEVKAGLDAVTALAPDATPASVSASTETTTQVFNAAGSRMTGTSVSGIGAEGEASGDNIFEQFALWVQGLFNKSKLDDTSTTQGFDADTNGIAMGVEKSFTENVKAGLGFAHSQTDISGFNRDTLVDTNTAMIYGEYKPSNWYVNGVATYSWASYAESKNVAGVGVEADYDAETYGLQAMTGYAYTYEGFAFTGEVGLRYVHISQDSYTDTAGQRVSSEDSDIWTGVIGVKVAKSWAVEEGINIIPEIRVGATYDFSNDNVSSVVTLANGSSYAVSGDALERFALEVGAGVTADVNDEFEFALSYTGKFRDDYQDHTGLINVKYKF